MRVWFALGGVSGAMAVAAGAISAHAADPLSSEWIAVAARYQMWHGLALLAVAWMSVAMPSRWATLAGLMFTAGIVLFSGSLYLAAVTGWQAATTVTPMGGVAFILGWLVLALAGVLAAKSAAGDLPRDGPSQPPRRS